VVVDSDEHDEQGHITEDFDMRVKQMDKRMGKECGIFEEIIEPEYDGPDSPDLLLVFWGSTKGPAGEAADILREQGKNVGTLYFKQVYPLDKRHFQDRLESAGQAVCIESNYTGQFSKQLKLASGFTFEKLVLRYDGLPLSARYILKSLEELD
jgi:2-oxoglutarate ferredoxin oxidoreductase subunit alpha